MARKAGKKPTSKKRPKVQAKLDWQNYHLLENLLFCAVKVRQVPAESGVCFHLRPVQPERSICLLFDIDRKPDPLITDGAALRPDYAVFYVQSGSALCTIIEMKSTAVKNLSHGLKQIMALRDALRQEIKTHLPGRFKPRFQGVLLHAPNAEVPWRKIEDEAKHGFVICPVQYHHSADLTYYTTTELALTSKPPRLDQPYKRPEEQWNLIERILIHQAAPKRIQDDFYQQNFPTETPTVDREGLYVNYRIANDTYLALMANRKRTVLGIHEPATGSWQAQIESWLDQAELGCTLVPLTRIP